MKRAYLIGLLVTVLITVQSKALAEDSKDKSDVLKSSEDVSRDKCGHYMWPWKPAPIYTVDRIPQQRTIVGSCTFDVGTCPVGSCPFRCQSKGYICPQTEIKAVDCDQFGSFNVSVVTKCTCCQDTGIVISGIITDSASNAPIQGVQILFNSRFAGTSNIKGQFTSTLFPVSTRLVISTRLNALTLARGYIDTVKEIDIPSGFRGRLDGIEIDLVMRSTPVIINSSVGAILSLSSTPSDPLAGNAKIEILPRSFKTQSGRVYLGKVKASVTYIDTANRNTVNSLPGRFLTNGQGYMLVSDGVVFFDFRDSNNNPLTVGPIRFTVRRGMMIWNLNSNARWDPVPKLGRLRRQAPLTDTFLAQVNTANWINIDKIPNAPKCYFKTRIFYQSNGAEIKTSATATFRPDILAFTSQNQRLAMYANPTNAPNHTCFEVRCPNLTADPTDVLRGFVNMTSYESVLVGGYSLSVVTVLAPRVLSGYDVAIQSSLAAINYAVLPNNMDIYVNFIANVNGPFYINKPTCEASAETEPAFHFIKPALPSYEPFPNDTKLCTARIGLESSGDFYNYLSNLTTLPTVSALSIWNHSGTKFYYTDTSVIQYSTNGGQEFYFVCLKYRCSQAGELTTVYLDVNATMIEVNITNTWNNTDIVETYRYPAFTCYGKCTKSPCSTDFAIAEVPNGSGSFEAPEDVGDGPDFFNSTVNDCSLKTKNDTFAYMFNCYSRQFGW